MEQNKLYQVFRDLIDYYTQAMSFSRYEQLVQAELSGKLCEAAQRHFPKLSTDFIEYTKSVGNSGFKVYNHAYAMPPNYTMKDILAYCIEPKLWWLKHHYKKLFPFGDVKVGEYVYHIKLGKGLIVEKRYDSFIVNFPTMSRKVFERDGTDIHGGKSI